MRRGPSGGGMVAAPNPESISPLRSGAGILAFFGGSGRETVLDWPRRVLPVDMGGRRARARRDEGLSSRRAARAGHAEEDRTMSVDTSGRPSSEGGAPDAPEGSAPAGAIAAAADDEATEEAADEATDGPTDSAPRKRHPSALQRVAGAIPEGAQVEQSLDQFIDQVHSSLVHATWLEPDRGAGGQGARGGGGPRRGGAPGRAGHRRGRSRHRRDRARHRRGRGRTRPRRRAPRLAAHGGPTRRSWSKQRPARPRPRSAPATRRRTSSRPPRPCVTLDGAGRSSCRRRSRSPAWRSSRCCAWRGSSGGDDDDRGTPAGARHGRTAGGAAPHPSRSCDR